jgi:hypothetical protein
MRKNSLFDQPHLKLSLTRSYNYITLTPNENFLSYTTFSKEPYHQNEVIEDWNTPELPLLRCIYLDSLESDTDLALDTILWHRYPTLVSFFASQMVDIPQPFRKSKSLYSASMATPELRFVTTLMKHGRKRYVSKLYSKVISNLLWRLSSRFEETSPSSHWRAYYNLFTGLGFYLGNRGISSLSVVTQAPNLEFTDKFRQQYSTPAVESSNHSWAYTAVNDELKRYLPLFSFYIRKVDKLKRKHSRGKSGKYSIVWKYVPQYRRLLTVIRWLTRDVKFQKPKTLFSRILQSIETLLFDRSNHLIFKFRNFVHHFVFQHHKKTLLKHLRSTS